MFRYLDKCARDDALVKIIFDHLRNFGLCCVMFGAAAWKKKHIGEGWVAIWDYVSITALAIAGFGLFWINYENLLSKLRRSPIRLWLRIGVVILYSVVIGQLYGYLAVSKSGI